MNVSLDFMETEMNRLARKFLAAGTLCVLSGISVEPVWSSSSSAEASGPHRKLTLQEKKALHKKKKNLDHHEKMRVHQEHRKAAAEQANPDKH